MIVLIALMLLADEPASQEADQPQVLSAVTGAEEPASAPVDAPNKAASEVGRGAVKISVNADQAQLSGQLKKFWSMVATLSTNAGLGLNTWTPYVGQSLSLQGAYVFRLPGDVRIRASVSESLSWDYTPPQNSSGQRFSYSDVVVGASSRLHRFEAARIDLWGALRFIIPLSNASITAKLLTGVIPGVGASRGFEWTSWGQRMNLNIRYDFVFRKNFNLIDTPSVTSVGDTPNYNARASDVLVGDALSRGFANLSMSFSNSLSVSFSPLDWLSVSLFLGITNSLSYPHVASVDQYTSPYATVGYGRSDLVRNGLDFTFTILPQLYMSAGLFTSEPPFGLNNRTLSDPLPNPSVAANNYTSFYLSVTGML